MREFSRRKIKQYNMKHIFSILLVSALMAMPLAAQDEYRPSEGMIGDGSYELSEAIQPIPTPMTIAQAVAALPALPTVEQICSAQVKSAYAQSNLAPYKAAIGQVMLIGTSQSQSLMMRIQAAQAKNAQRGQRAMQQYNSNVNAGLMPSQQEMMELYMSGAITENMSEAQMMDVMAAKFAQKWGVSKDDYIKIMNLAQRDEKQAAAYLKSNHPQLYQRLYAANVAYGDENVLAEDTRDTRFAEIAEELRSLLEQVMQSVGDNSSDAYGQLADNMREEWKTCAEAKQIDAIETKLWERVQEWESTLNVYGGEVTYPAWWTEERKKENAQIDKWNRRNAEKWLKIATEEDKALRTMFEKIGALETENEELGQQGDTENMIYLMNKQQLITFYGMLQQLFIPIERALMFPCVEHQEETGSAILGKG